MRPAQLFGWSGTGFHALCVIALIVAVAIYAKRIGGAGPWLIAVVGVLDLLVTMTYALASMATMGTHLSLAAIESTYDILRVVDMLLTLLSAGLVVGAFALMRARPAR